MKQKWMHVAKDALLVLLVVVAVLLVWKMADKKLEEEPMQNVSVTASPQDDAVPELDSAHALSRETTARVWYRFGEEPMLASEERTISRRPNETYETALLRVLLGGPTLGATELEGLFPTGTRVISTARQGDMLFVTLSYQLMNFYSDEPENWRKDAQWTAEMQLRRRLAMQAIVATVTENTTAQQVVILVEQREETTDSMRLREKYYLLDEKDESLAQPLVRDESVLLTASGTMQTILTALTAQDYPRLYRYLAPYDTESGDERPEYDAFVEQMQSFAPITSSAASNGSVSTTTAVFVLSGTRLQQGREVPFAGHTLRLTRQNGLWRISMRELMTLMEEKS